MNIEIMTMTTSITMLITMIAFIIKDKIDEKQKDKELIKYIDYRHIHNDYYLEDNYSKDDADFIKTFVFYQCLNNMFK